jgi:hypothetical protein
MIAPHRPSRPGESGHLLVGLMVLIAVMLILLTVTGQSWVFVMRRDAEAELIFRGEEYARALMFYKAETGSFPLELKALMQKGPHRHRYIRRLYKDPLAKDGKWGQLYLSPTGKGFINPYATRMDTEDPFGGDRTSVFEASGAKGGRGTFNSRRPLEDSIGSSGQPSVGLRDRDRSDEDEESPGYSELTPEEFAARGGEQQGLPIIGVVHKHRESGLKIYKNQANLNDWAFTLLLEGQETLGSPTGAGGTGPNVPIQKGIGDAASPFMLHREAPKPDLNPFQKRLQEAHDPNRRQHHDEGDDQNDQRDDSDQDQDQEDDDQGYSDDGSSDEDPNEPSHDISSLLS